MVYPGASLDMKLTEATDAKGSDVRVSHLRGTPVPETLLLAGVLLLDAIILHSRRHC